MNSMEVNLTFRCADGEARIQLMVSPPLSWEEIGDLDTAIKLRPERWQQIIDRLKRGHTVQIVKPKRNAA